MKQVYSKLTWAIVAATLLIISCKSANFANSDYYTSNSSDYILPLFHTSDVHGYLVTTQSKPYTYNLAYISDKVHDKRGYGKSYNKGKALLLDSGDMFQGTTISNLQKGQPLYSAFDQMGYDAVAVGNHEFDWGLTNVIEDDATLLPYEYDGVTYKNDVPVLCANLFQNGSRVSKYTKDYIILDKSAVNEKGKKSA